MAQYRMHPVADEGVAAIRVDFPDELTGYADDVEEPAVALPQAAFDLDPLGKVMGDHRETQQAAGFTLPDRRDGGRAEEAGPVLAPVPALHRVPALLAGGRDLRFGQAADGGIGREEQGIGMAYDFFRRVPLDPAGAIVPARDGTVGSQHVDGVILDAVHQQRLPPLADQNVFTRGGNLPAQMHRVAHQPPGGEAAGRRQQRAEYPQGRAVRRSLRPSSARDGAQLPSAVGQHDVGQHRICGEQFRPPQEHLPRGAKPVPPAHGEFHHRVAAVGKAGLAEDGRDIHDDDGEPPDLAGTGSGAGTAIRRRIAVRQDDGKAADDRLSALEQGQRPLDQKPALADDFQDGAPAVGVRQQIMADRLLVAGKREEMGRDGVAGKRQPPNTGNALRRRRPPRPRIPSASVPGLLRTSAIRLRTRNRRALRACSTRARVAAACSVTVATFCSA